MRLNIIPIVVFMLVAALEPQQAGTLPERVNARQKNVALVAMNKTEPVPFSAVVDRASLIVRATVGRGVGHLTADQRDVYTTYELVNPKVLFGSFAQTAARPGAVVQPLSVAMHGGTVSIGRFTASVRYDGAPVLNQGMEVVLLLRREGELYWPTADAGLFSVIDSKIVPLSKRSGDRRFAGRDVNDVTSELVTLKGQGK